MLDMGYLRNPISGVIKLGLDAVTGNIKTDGKKNTPADYAAAAANDYVENKTKSSTVPQAQEWIEENVKQPATEWVEEKTIEPIKGGVQVVSDVITNGYQAAESLVIGGVDTVKKYAPLVAAGAIAVLLLKK